MKILVTTSLEETHGKAEEILFAGDWVKSSLNFEKDFSNRKFSFFDSIWKNEEDIKKFHYYLSELRDGLVEKLSFNLNKIHKTNYPNRFWKILINPWLHYYLEGTYTRFETINRILDKKEYFNFIYLNNLKSLDAPFDVRDYSDYNRDSDIYNQFIFQKIISYFNDIKKNKFLKLIYSNKEIARKENLNYLNQNEKQNLLRKSLNFFLKRLSKNNRFFIELNSMGSYFVLLNLKLGQIPFKDYEFFNYKNYYQLLKNKSKSDFKLRKKILIDFNKNNEFENYLNENFFQDIPTFLLEDFSSFQKFTKKIPYKSEVIVSDIKHEHDTIFKFWMANSVVNGSKLITSDHGGNYGGIFWHSIMHEDISDFTIRWFKPIKKNNIQLPVLHLLSKQRKNKNNRKYLLTIGFGGTKYPKDIFIGPISGQILYQVDQLDSFYKNLNIELKNSFFYRPNRYDHDWNFQKRLEPLFKNKIIPSTKKYLHYFKMSKVIVCTQPKTAFCESMVTGPTVLLTKEKYHKNRDEFKELHESLRKAKILFEDPIEASKHLNNVWKNVDDWWESEVVVDARKKFMKEAALIETNALEKWKNFFQSL